MLGKRQKSWSSENTHQEARVVVTCVRMKEEERVKLGFWEVERAWTDDEE